MSTFLNPIFKEGGFIYLIFANLCIPPHTTAVLLIKDWWIRIKHFKVYPV